MFKNDFLKIQFTKFSVSSGNFFFFGFPNSHTLVVKDRLPKGQSPLVSLHLFVGGTPVSDTRCPVKRQDEWEGGVASTVYRIKRRPEKTSSGIRLIFVEDHSLEKPINWTGISLLNLLCLIMI